MPGKQALAEFRRRMKPLLLNPNQDKSQKTPNPYTRARMNSVYEDG
jgi:hypothetical protein